MTEKRLSLTEVQKAFAMASKFNPKFGLYWKGYVRQDEEMSYMVAYTIYMMALKIIGLWGR